MFPASNDFYYSQIDPAIRETIKTAIEEKNITLSSLGINFIPALNAAYAKGKYDEIGNYLWSLGLESPKADQVASSIFQADRYLICEQILPKYKISLSALADDKLKPIISIIKTDQPQDIFNSLKSMGITLEQAVNIKNDFYYSKIDLTIRETIRATHIDLFNIPNVDTIIAQLNEAYTRKDYEKVREHLEQLGLNVEQSMRVMEAINPTTPLYTSREKAKQNFYYSQLSKPIAKALAKDKTINGVLEKPKIGAKKLSTEYILTKLSGKKHVTRVYIEKLNSAYEKGDINLVEEYLLKLGLNHQQTDHALQKILALPETKKTLDFGYENSYIEDTFYENKILFFCPENFAPSVAQEIITTIEKEKPENIAKVLVKYGIISESPENKALLVAKKLKESYYAYYGQIMYKNLASQGFAKDDEPDEPQDKGNGNVKPRSGA